MDKNNKLTSTTVEQADAIGAYAKNGSIARKAFENRFFIAGEDVKIQRAVGLHIGHGLSGVSNNQFEAYDNVMVQSAGEVHEVWGVLAAESGVNIYNNHAVITGGKADYFGGIAQAENRFLMLDSSSGESNPSESSFEVAIHNNRTTMTGGEVFMGYTRMRPHTCL